MRRPQSLTSPVGQSSPVVGYIFPFSRNDTESPPSTIGAAGLFTNNGSRAFALGGEFYFKENTYKATCRIRSRQFGLQHLWSRDSQRARDKVASGTDGGSLLRRVPAPPMVGFLPGTALLRWKLRNYSQNKRHRRDSDSARLGLHSTLRSVGFRLQRDTRPNHFYPIAGLDRLYSGFFRSVYRIQVYFPVLQTDLQQIQQPDERILDRNSF